MEREIFDFIKEVANWKEPYASTRLRLKAKALVKDATINKAFAITSNEGWNQLFWNEKDAQDMIDTAYKEDFPNQLFWIDEVTIQ